MTQQSAFSAGGSANSASARKWITLAMVAGLALASTGCAKLESRDQMNQGVQAYRDSHYAEAADHFQKAVQLDADNKNALEYLATSYFTQWVPGAESADNKRHLQLAQQTFQKVLDKYPNDPLALATMAAMSYNIAAAKPTDQEKAAAMEDTRKWNERRLQADPKDSEAYYYLGVIDWSQSNPPIHDARIQERKDSANKAAKEALKRRHKEATPIVPTDNTGPLTDEKVRAELKQKYGPMIDQGIDNLKKSLAINNENEDAMEYINLLLRSKAALDDTKEEADADLAKANQWNDKSLATKRMKAMRPKKNQENS